MSDPLPLGYVTILQAAETLLLYMCAGEPDKAGVTKGRESGRNVSDGGAKDEAIGEIWKAVDSKHVRAVAIGGRPRRIVSLTPAITEEIPMLRSPRGRGFTHLRPSTPAFHALARSFGSDLTNVTVAFREREIQKLGRRLVRTRRRDSRTGAEKRKGRPPRQLNVRPVIQEIIKTGKWSAIQGFKALTRLVNRAGKWEKPVSEDTVGRALDSLYEEETQDRRYQRIRRARN